MKEYQAHPTVANLEKNSVRPKIIRVILRGCPLRARSRVGNGLRDKRSRTPQEILAAIDIIAERYSDAVGGGVMSEIVLDLLHDLFEYRSNRPWISPMTYSRVPSLF